MSEEEIKAMQDKLFEQAPQTDSMAQCYIAIALLEIANQLRLRTALESKRFTT